MRCSTLLLAGAATCLFSSIASLVAPAEALAVQDQLILTSEMDPRNATPARKEYIYCFIQDLDNNTNFRSQIVLIDPQETTGWPLQFYGAVKAKHPISSLEDVFATCVGNVDRGYVDRLLEKSLATSRRAGRSSVEVYHNFSVVRQSTPSKTAGTIPAPESDQSAAKPAAKTQADYEAEWQAELDEYAAEKAAWEAKITAQKREEERKKAEHEARQEKAALAKAAHEKKMEAHRRELEEANRRQEQYEAEKRRHTECLSWNKEACDAIVAGKPALDDKLADAGEASTDTEATTCVSRPVVSGNATFQGNTAAMVVNGCETAVDVRICLLREGGWNCGVKWGLQPQDRFSHSSFKATGEIFWDARVAGSNQPLGSPGGS